MVHVGSIKVAIIGVGNCACAFVQGIEYYQDVAPHERVPGLMNARLADYHVGDIDVVCAFDIDERKIGRDAGEAIFAKPNTMKRVLEGDLHLDAPVYLGPEEDPRSAIMDEVEDAKAYLPADGDPIDPRAKLEEHDVDVLVNLLPADARATTERWMQAAVDAGVAVVNGVPVGVASDASWAKRFEDAGVPVLGDDVKGQLGATITHRALARAFESRGVQLGETYQLNVGGNTDFLTGQEGTGADEKRSSATSAVQSQLDEPLDERDVKAGPSDYVSFLDDEGISFIRMQGTGFLGAPVELELRLSLESSPNAGASVLEAVRCAKIASDRGLGGAIEAPSSAFFKRPPVDGTDEDALERLAVFLEDADAAGRAKAEGKTGTGHEQAGSSQREEGEQADTSEEDADLAGGRDGAGAGSD